MTSGSRDSGECTRPVPHGPHELPSGGVCSPPPPGSRDSERRERTPLTKWWDHHLAVAHHYTRDIPPALSWVLFHAQRWPECQSVPPLEVQP